MSRAMVAGLTQTTGVSTLGTGGIHANLVMLVIYRDQFAAKLFTILDHCRRSLTCLSQYLESEHIPRAFGNLLAFKMIEGEPAKPSSVYVYH